MARRSPSLLLALALLGLASGAAAQPLTVQEAITVSDRVASLDGEIARALSEMEEKTAAKERVDAEISGLGERRAAARQRMRTRARALYRLTRAGMLPLAGGLPAMLSHLARVERLRRMVKDDLDALRSLNDRGDALRRETGNLARSLQLAQLRVRELNERKDSLLHEQRAADLFDHAFSAATPAPMTPAPTYGSIRVVDQASGPSFAAQRGRLATPVSGGFSMREASRDEGPGLELIATPGTPVRAAAEGRVAFSDRYGAYGRLVILDHGDGYFTVYGGLGQVTVRQGDYVGRGARLGDVGTDFTPTALFFQVRQGTRSLSPRPWLGL